MSAAQQPTEFEVLVGKLDEIVSELHRLEDRASRRFPSPGQEQLWDDESSSVAVVDVKAFVLELFERARRCPEPAWPYTRRKIIEEFEIRLWAVLDALARPERADIEDLEELRFEIEAQMYYLLKKRALLGSA